MRERRCGAVYIIKSFCPWSPMSLLSENSLAFHAVIGSHCDRVRGGGGSLGLL